MTFTKNVQKQQYYTSNQLYDIFKADTKIDKSLINVVTKRALVRHLHTYVDTHPLFYKVTEGFPSKTKYI